MKQNRDFLNADRFSESDMSKKIYFKIALYLFQSKIWRVEKLQNQNMTRCIFLFKNPTRCKFLYQNLLFNSSFQILVE